MFEGHVGSTKQLNLLYDDPISTIPWSQTWRETRRKSTSLRLVTKVVEAPRRTTATRRVENAWPVCRKRIPCEEGNSHFRSQKFFDNHRKRRAKKKPYASVSDIVVRVESSRYAKTPNVKSDIVITVSRKKDVSHHCYMRPLKNVLQPAIRYWRYSSIFRLHRMRDIRKRVNVPNLLFVQQLCSRCEDVADAQRKCVQCGEIKHFLGWSRWEHAIFSIWTAPLGYEVCCHSSQHLHSTYISSWTKPSCWNGSPNWSWMDWI